MSSEVQQTVIKNPTWWKRRTRMERCLTLSTTLAIIIGILLLIALVTVLYHGNLQIRNSQFNAETLQNTTFTVPATDGKNQQNICLSAECIHTASRVLQYMDESKDPCENFYDFTCGNFVKKTNIPDDTYLVNSFSIIRGTLQEHLRTAIEEPIQPNEPNPFKLVKKLYKACMNKNRIEERGLKTIQSIMKQLGGWPVLDGDSWTEGSFNWTKFVYDYRKVGRSLDYFMDFSIVVDTKNLSNRIIDVDQASLGLKREYLIKGLDNKIVKAYYDYMVDIAVLFGADRKRAENDLVESLSFEMELAKISLPSEKRRNAAALYNPMTIAQLEEKFPSIPWIEYFNNLLAPDTKVTRDEKIVVSVPSYIANFEALISRTPKRVQANYVLSRIAAASVPHLNEALRKRELEYNTIVNGRTEREPRWKECVDFSTRGLIVASGALYARKYFNENARQNAKEIAADIKSEFYENLKQVDWMDEKTKRNALDKAKSIATHIAYPDELLDDAKIEEFYEGLELDPEDYIRSLLNITLYATRLSFKRLRKPVNNTDWRTHGWSADVNAFYAPFENSIQFPAGILQGVFFHGDRPRYMNYGAIGFIMGHEITHGFDDRGRQFDKNGNLDDWWEEQTKTAFVEKAQCFINQYGNYYVPELGLNLNGLKTQGENIADNGGIKQAYLAYNRWLERNGEEQQLPGLKYTGRQMFWISAATVWCSKIRIEELQQLVLADEHIPDRYRVIVPFANMEYFAKDFHCPINSNMNPELKCKLW